MLPHPIPPIQEELTFGIDLGIASCGWAVLKKAPSQKPEILAAGSWCFNTPEEDKTRTPLNQNRREKRLLRRVIKRRRQRMQHIRALFREAGLLTLPAETGLGAENPLKSKNKIFDLESREVLGQIGAYLRKESWDELSPWTLRTRALDVKLSGPELAVALGHIAKHRGFKSNAKNGGKEDSKMKDGINAVHKIIQENPDTYRTFAEVLTKHPNYQEHKGRLRNRYNIYDCTPSRALLLEEVRSIFDNQRDLGSKIASESLEKNFIDIAFFQRSLQDPIKLLGQCSFEPSQKRVAMKAPSFEKFRFFSKLNHIEIPTLDRDGVLGVRRLFPEELKGLFERLSSASGWKAKFTYKDLRKFLRLDDRLFFASVPFEEEGKKDITLSSTQSKGAFSGSWALLKVLGGEIWEKLHQNGKGLKILDDCAQILSFYATPETMEKAFKAGNIRAEISEKLLMAAEDGKFTDFTKASHLSAKACRNIIPYLLEGNVYSTACEQAGYDHAAASRDGWEQILTHKNFVTLIKDFTEGNDKIANPSARKALTEGLKQLWAMRQKFGLPGKIAIELARDVGKSAEERGKIEKRINDTTAQRNKERQEAAEQLGLEPHQISSETLLRYRLWKEQNGFCLYSGKTIPAHAFNSPEFEIDHILPWSRFGDDSYNNKTLAYLSENQKKGRNTPKEYLSAERWEIFKQEVEKLRCKGIKKRNYLLLTTKEKEEGFRTRNLNETKYAARVFAQCAELFYDKKDRHRTKGGKRRVFTRPGALTAALRQGWGVEHFKKSAEKDPKTGRRARIPDDRHHALDAIVLACVDSREIEHLTECFKENEGKKGDERNIRTLSPSPLGWRDFAQDVKAALDHITVARPENRRARGQGHEETIRSFKKDEETGALLEISSRKSLKGLKPVEAQKLLENLKDKQRNPHIKEALEKWIQAGCPADALPRSPKGDEIRRVVVVETQKSGVELKTGNGKGLVSAGAITRVDVFSKKKTSGKNKGQKEFYLVPVYRWQVMRNILPMHACLAATDEKDWLFMDEAKGFSFEFSLYSGSYIKLTQKKKGKEMIIAGYFAGMDRATAAIGIKNENNPQDISRGIGVRNLPSFEKYHIDRFGTLTKIEKEVRQWHGKRCI